MRSIGCCRCTITGRTRGTAVLQSAVCFAALFTCPPALPHTLLSLVPDPDTCTSAQANCPLTPGGTAIARPRRKEITPALFFLLPTSEGCVGSWEPPLQQGSLWPLVLLEPRAPINHQSHICGRWEHGLWGHLDSNPGSVSPWLCDRE